MTRASEPCPVHFPPGQELAALRWRLGWGPFHELLQGLKLPPRGPVGSKQNEHRARIVQRAMHRLAAKHRREQARAKAAARRWTKRHGATAESPLEHVKAVASALHGARQRYQQGKGKR